MIIRSLALAGLLAAASAAHAVTVFADNFDANTVGENAAPSGWTVTTDAAKASMGTGVGTVDTLGPGYFDLMPGHGDYIDLDGSTHNAGILSHGFSTVAGMTYQLSFSLAGSQRNFVETVDVKFGSLTATYSMNPTDGFVTDTLSFTASTTGTSMLSFENRGGDLEGALLDNVVVSAAPVPEPETYALMLAGLGALGFMAKRRRN